MDFHDYVDFLTVDEISNYKDNKLVNKHVTFLAENSDLKKLKHDIAILGVPGENTVNPFEPANAIRKQFYSLATLNNALNIIDLGNVKVGHSFNDTCFAIREIIASTINLNIVVVMIGGSSRYNLGSFLAYEKTETPMNMVSVDSVINQEKLPLLVAKDLNLNDSLDTASSYNFINIGYQSYFVEKTFLDYLNDSYYEAYRLGFVRANLKEMEPGLRDANMISFSLNSVKHSDAPGVSFSSPNGLTGDEICQLSFYAGHSNRVKSFGIFDIDTRNDSNFTTAKLSAQILWYFLEGQSSSVYEEPDSTPENFVKYVIHLDQTNQNIAFFKSNLTNRWWMEIVYPQSNRSILLSCSESDYELACSQDVPDRWWRTFHRVSH